VLECWSVGVLEWSFDRARPRPRLGALEYRSTGVVFRSSSSSIRFLHSEEYWSAGMLEWHCPEWWYVKGCSDVFCSASGAIAVHPE
jgi:hypothetical protein